jgi:hypothetical protein
VLALAAALLAALVWFGARLVGRRFRRRA